MLQSVTIGADTPETGPVAPATVSSTARPDNIPEKFWDAASGTVKQDVLLSSYAALEGRLGASPAPPAGAPPAGTKAAPQTPPADGLAITTPPPASQFPFTEADMVSWSEEYTTTGGLSDATYAIIQSKGGYPRPLVDTWLAGQRALGEQSLAKAHDMAGGTEEYHQMSEWARGALSPAEREGFNKAVAHPGAVRDNAINGLVARWRGDEGQEAGRRIAGSGIAGAGAGFRSTAEMVAAMRDPRYAKDPAYRADVEEKARALA